MSNFILVDPGHDSFSAAKEQITRALIETRRNKHITQKHLAELTGITQPDISRLENGRSNPSLRTLDNLARGLGMELQIRFVPSDE